MADTARIYKKSPNYPNPNLCQSSIESLQIPKNAFRAFEFRYSDLFSISDLEFGYYPSKRLRVAATKQSERRKASPFGSGWMVKIERRATKNKRPAKLHSTAVENIRYISRTFDKLTFFCKTNPIQTQFQ